MLVPLTCSLASSNAKRDLIKYRVASAQTSIMGTNRLGKGDTLLLEPSPS
jgi:hypothetical protein